MHGNVDAGTGSNGCVYPTDVTTLFNQFNAAGVSWKAYAQDLGGAQPTGATSYVTGSTPGVSDTVPGREDGQCGYPGMASSNPVTSPTNLVAPSGDVSSFTGAQPANANNNGDPADQFVAKHFPTPWFSALTGESAGTQSMVNYPAQPALNQPTVPEFDGPGAPTSGATDSNCDANHVANLDDPTYGLAHDLSLPANQVPAFNWITPNNCSDAHDASCQGNNLSGAFNANGTPNYTPAGLPADDPEATTPANFTGGLYAADLFLRYYIPMIEQSAAFADGGMIDVTFDEANPPFTVGNSFNNVPAPGDSTIFPAPADQPSFGSPGTTEPGADSLYGAYGALADAAGENINGHNVSTEPTGPNDPEVTNGSGQQLQPGPGASGFIDRPTGLAGESANLSGSPGPATEPALVAANSSMVTDSKINAQDTGRLVSGTDANGNTIPPDTFVGAVSDTGPIALGSNSSTTTASNNFAKPWIGTYQLLNDSGQPVTLPTGYNGNVTLSAEGATSTVGGTSCPTGSEAATTSGCVTADQLFDPTDFTPGGGDTGTVLISPLIKPGTVSSTYYNHYSALRSLEDLFLTGKSCTNPSNADTPLAAGTVCGGLDGQGHIGYAAQAGLASFGPDVFSAEHFAPVTVPHGFATVSGSGATALYCPVHVNLGPGARRAPSREPAASVGLPVWRERPAAGRAAARVATAVTVSRRPATAATVATVATAPAHPRSSSTGSGSPRPVRRRRRSTRRPATASSATGATAARGARASATFRVATAATGRTAHPGTPARMAQRARRARRSAGNGWTPPHAGSIAAGAGHAGPAPACCASLSSWERSPSPVVAVGVGRACPPPCRGRPPRTTPPSSRRRRSIRQSTPR